MSRVIKLDSARAGPCACSNQTLRLGAVGPPQPGVGCLRPSQGSYQVGSAQVRTRPQLIIEEASVPPSLPTTSTAANPPPPPQPNRLLGPLSLHNQSPGGQPLHQRHERLIAPPPSRQTQHVDFVCTPHVLREKAGFSAPATVALCMCKSNPGPEHTGHQRACSWLQPRWRAPRRPQPSPQTGNLLAALRGRGMELRALLIAIRIKM